MDQFEVAFLPTHGLVSGTRFAVHRSVSIAKSIVVWTMLFSCLSGGPIRSAEPSPMRNEPFALLHSSVLPVTRERKEDGTQNMEAHDVWHSFCAATLAFQEGGSRNQFLAACKELLAKFPDNRYDEQLKSLIGPLEREAAKPRPTFLDKAPEQRTQEETIQYWIYELRDLAGHQCSSPGYPELFSWNGIRPTAADQLVALGPPAIPYLIEALEDDTPTRTIAFQRFFYPIHFILRRQDVAMKCLERIVGCQFYNEASTAIHLYSDTPERRASAIANVKAWWKKSKGTTQARMVRNQLALMDENASLRVYARIHALEVLAMLEGPEAVMEEGMRLLAEDKYGLNSPVMEFLDHVDPGAPVRLVFKRFWGNKTQDGDYTYVLKYGDQKVYREIVKRLNATGSLDPGAWVASDQAEWAAQYGQNWAIPIVAKVLDKTKMTGARYVNEKIGSQPFSNADEAAEIFQKLTGMDFGYRREGGEAERLAAINKARDWWEGKGRTLLAEKIAKDHPPVLDPGDLFMSDEDVAKRVAAIKGSDAAVRRKTVASLGKVFSPAIQRALLDAVTRERDANARIQILRVIKSNPSIWHFPVLTQLFEKDPHAEVRILAGEVIKTAVGNKGTSIWQNRLETREMALDASRRLARDSRTPIEVRKKAAEVLMAWDYFTDRPVLRTLANAAAFKEFQALQTLIREGDDLQKRIPTLRPPEE